MNHQKPIVQFGGGAGSDPLKRSPSELALEALLRPHTIDANGIIQHTINDSFCDFHYNDQPPFADPTATDDHVGFGFKNQEIIKGYSPRRGLGNHLSPSWYGNFNKQQSSVSATIDSQSSIICAGSPTSTLKPKAGENQGSGSSDDEDLETEDGPCEQSNDPIDIKRMRRMVSNKESARRSRRRKQAQLQELEIQVQQLSGENVGLYKQLTDAAQQLKDATTNNRVLKSDVEALRAKVELAQDMVTRGSLSCSLNHLLQAHLGSPQMPNTQSLPCVGNLSSVITGGGQGGSFGGAASSGITNYDIDRALNGIGDGGSGLGSDAASRISGIWS